MPCPSPDGSICLAGNLTLRPGLGLAAHNLFVGYAGNSQGQRMHVSELSIDKSECMGIRGARGIAEAEEDIDRSHVFVDNITSFGHRQLVYGKTYIAGSVGIIEVPGSIYAALKTGAWNTEGGFDSPVREMIEVSIPTGD